MAGYSEKLKNSWTFPQPLEPYKYNLAPFPATRILRNHVLHLVSSHRTAGALFLQMTIKTVSTKAETKAEALGPQIQPLELCSHKNLFSICTPRSTRLLTLGSNQAQGWSASSLPNSQSRNRPQNLAQAAKTKLKIDRVS